MPFTTALLLSNRWLRWAAHGAAGERAEYVFFSTDTVATRAEALAHGDLVLFSEHGMPQEEWALVQKWRSTVGSSGSSGSSVGRQSSFSRGARGTHTSGGGAGPDDEAARGAGSSRPVPRRGVGTSERRGRYGRGSTSTSGGSSPSSAEAAPGGSDVKRHPKLCREDQERVCSGLEAGGGRIDNCMFAHRRKLDLACLHDLAACVANAKPPTHPPTHKRAPATTPPLALRAQAQAHLQEEPRALRVLYLRCVHVRSSPELRSCLCFRSLPSSALQV